MFASSIQYPPHIRPFQVPSKNLPRIFVATLPHCRDVNPGSTLTSHCHNIATCQSWQGHHHLTIIIFLLWARCATHCHAVIHLNSQYSAVIANAGSQSHITWEWITKWFLYWERIAPHSLGLYYQNIHFTQTQHHKRKWAQILGGSKQFYTGKLCIF